jgi:hypothetical protein
MLKSNPCVLSSRCPPPSCLRCREPRSPKRTAKKLTYEQAFKRCKAFMDQERGSLGAGPTSDANKATRGASCMKRFGHRL